MMDIACKALPDELPESQPVLQIVRSGRKVIYRYQTRRAIYAAACEKGAERK